MPAPDEISLFAGRFNDAGADYMITGATAAIIYGQPRLTNDLDVVLALSPVPRQRPEEQGAHGGVDRAKNRSNERDGDAKSPVDLPVALRY